MTLFIILKMLALALDLDHLNVMVNVRGLGGSPVTRLSPLSP